MDEDGATNAAEVMRRCLENDDDTTLALSAWTIGSMSRSAAMWGRLAIMVPMVESCATTRVPLSLLMWVTSKQLAAQRTHSRRRWLIRHGVHARCPVDVK